jgi:pilus assembly protein Flp/PilA
MKYASGAVFHVTKNKFFREMMMSAIVKFMKDEDGVVAIEYVIIAAALVGVLAAVFSGMGTTLTTKLQAIVNSITT